MRVREDDVEKKERLILELIRERQPTWSELRKATGFSEPTLWRYLKSLEERGLIRKCIDGRWVLGESYSIFSLRKRIEKAFDKKFAPIVVEDYGALLCDPESVDKEVDFDYWKGSLWGLRRPFWDAAELFMRELYLNYTKRILYTLSPETRDKVAEALLKLTCLGYMILKRVDRVDKDMREFESESLSNFLYKGLEHAIGEEDVFLYNLRMYNVLGDLAKFALLGVEKAPMGYGLKELLGEAPELAKTLKKKLFNKLAKLRVMAIICLGEDMFARPLSLQNMIEKWLEALRYGALDHREHVFSDDKISLLKDFAHLLEKKLTSGLSLEEEKMLEEMMYEKIDWDEPWTLGDLYKYHPRGKTPQFYAGILNEILLRKIERERALPPLSFRGAILSEMFLSETLLRKIKLKFAKKVDDIIPPDKPSPTGFFSLHPGTIRSP